MVKVKSFSRALAYKFLPCNDPGFMIIGAQRCGTSTLHYYLNHHPSLAGSIPKEVHYYDIWMNHGYTLEWYRSHFKALKKLWNRNVLFYESSPNYIYIETVAQMLAKSYPRLKMIVLVRNPVERAYSAWNMYANIFRQGALDKLRIPFTPGCENPIYKYLCDGRDQFPSFREAIDIELELIREGREDEPSILRRGLYIDQIDNYLKYFDRSQILIVGFRELTDQASLALNKIADFLGISPFKGTYDRIRNGRRYGRPLSEDDKKFLEEFYGDSNRKLFNFLGYKPNW
jgi:hypothetical protein